MNKLNNLCYIRKLIIIVIYLKINYLAQAINDSLFTEISYNQIDNSRKDYAEIIINSPIIKSYSLVKIKKLIYSENIFINLDDNIRLQGKLYKNNDYIKLKTDDPSIYGSFLYKGEKLRGYIQYKLDKYEIRPIDSISHIIFLIDQSEIPSEDCKIDNDSSRIEKRIKDNNNITTIQDECNIRVLVSYTPAARNRRGGDEEINNDIQWAIELTNESYQNSNVNQRIELARSILTNYTETGNWNTDYNRFCNPNDGYMDELEDIRDIYSADCMVLIIDYNGPICGKACAILANESTARCVVNARGTCLTTNFSFAHELGHLMGCRHNTGADPNNNPFPYGHGFCNQTDDWRTIMSYLENCGTTRLQFWSNPDIEFQGDPMGDAQCCDNARVLDETEETVREFRLTPLNYTIPDHTVVGFNIADFLARSTLETSQDFIAEPNTTVTLRAGDEIIMHDGFHAQAGTELHAFIDDDCDGVVGDEMPKSNAGNILLDYKTKPIAMSVYPNPVSNIARIEYYLPSESLSQMSLLNIYGRTVKTLKEQSNNKRGNYSHDFDVSALPSGIYFLTLKSDGEVVTKQFAVVR